MVANTERFEKAIRAFDDYHALDPVTETWDGRIWPRELLYTNRMVARMRSFAPEADEHLQLAVRCQHLGRWEIPRDRFPLDRKGYLQWRNAEKAHHATIAGKILTECGYREDDVEAVQKLVLKKELTSNERSQTLEDIACLVFIEYYLNDFAMRYSDEKIIDILRKTMRKMSGRAIELAGSIAPEGRIRQLLSQAARQK